MMEKRGVKRYMQLRSTVGYVVVCVTTTTAAVWVVYSVTANGYLAGWTALVLVVWSAMFSSEVDWLVRQIVKNMGLNQNRDGSPTSPTRHYETATIAYDLVPCLEEFMSDSRPPKSCMLVITGNDCHTLTIPPEDYPWIGYLEEVLESDQCHVVQYVSHGKHRADGILEELHERFPDRFEYRRLVNPEVVADPEDRELIKALQTFHPTLAWKGKGGRDDEKMMWIERYHPSASSEAYSCDYFDAKTLTRNSEAFDFFREKLNDAWVISQNHGSERLANAVH